jgi:hypothetical protein
MTAGPDAEWDVVAGSRSNVNAKRGDAGWLSPEDKLHGRVVVRRWVVEMARTLSAIRRSTDRGRSLARARARSVFGFSPNPQRQAVHRELRRAAKD